MTSIMAYQLGHVYSIHPQKDPPPKKKNKLKKKDRKWQTIVLVSIRLKKFVFFNENMWNVQTSTCTV